MNEADKNTLDILIQAPRVEQPKTFSFPKQTMVQDVITTLKNDSDLKLDVNGTYVLTTVGADAQVLDPNRPLASYQIQDGAVLTISADGGGV